jgi:hypothetical protein
MDVSEAALTATNELNFYLALNTGADFIKFSTYMPF